MYLIPLVSDVIFLTSKQGREERQRVVNKDLYARVCENQITTLSRDEICVANLKAPLRMI